MNKKLFVYSMVPLLFAATPTQAFSLSWSSLNLSTLAAPVYEWGKENPSEALFTRTISAIVVIGIIAGVFKDYYYLKPIKSPEEAQQLLFTAAEAGNLRRLKHALENGADINKTDGHNNTVLHIAKWHGQKEVIHFLLSSKYQISAITLIQSDISFKIAQPFLQNRDLSIDMQGAYGNTALHYAAAANKTAWVNYLLKNGACQLQNNNGQTPLYYAAKGGCIEILKLLLKNDTDQLNKQDLNGNTPLHLTLIYGSFDAATLLLQKGAQIDIPNNVGITVRGYIGELRDARSSFAKLDSMINFQQA